MKENKFTFPVFLARDTVATVSEKGYPQTWIISSKGILEWIWLGDDTRWREAVDAKLEEMRKTPN